MPNLISKLTKSIHQSHFLVAACVGIVAGTILGLVFHINYFASPIWLGFAALLLIIAYLRPKAALVIIALLAGMILAFFRVTDNLSGENYIRELYDQQVTVTGTVKADPNTDESGTKFKLTDLAFGTAQPQPAAGNIYISIKSTDQLHRSDRVTLEGKLTSGFGTYAGFMYRPTILNISRPSPGDPVFGIRNWFSERVKAKLPHPESSLGLSYLLGMKTGLPDELSEDLRTVGLVHIVVASGAHLSILVEVARKIFGRLSRFAGLVFSILFIIFFMTMVGFTPSIMRAGIMAILTLLAWYVGRKFAPWRIILIVAAITLIYDPSFIIDLGWLLSFASFTGIMILGPRLTKFLYGNKKPGFIASTVITTISATLMTLPITLYYFGQISLISVVANLLILPTLPVAMGLTFMTGVLADLPIIGDAVAFLATKLLDFHIGTVDFFAEMHSFLIHIDPYQPWVFTLYIPIAVWLVAYFYREKRINYLISGQYPEKIKKVNDL